MLNSEEQQELQRIREEFGRCTVVPSYNMKACYEVMLEMDDGVLLRTILYRTDRAGAAPTIVVRTCYPNNDYIYRATAEEYCKRGYNYIYQYCRGTGGSEGQWEPNVNERADGKKTIDWIAAQDWVGNIGYCGSSYLALTGWLIADILPEKVKTMYLTHYGTQRYVSAYQDGMFRHDVLTAWTMENAGYPVTADYLESCMYHPHLEVDEALWGKKIDWYRDWITSTDRDDAYWNTGFWALLRDIPAKVKIPIYMGEGWYDHHLASAIETYKALSEECKEKSHFRIGAWDHGFNIRLEDRGGEHFEKDDILRAFYWFQNLLEAGNIPETQIDYYIIGADRWYSRKHFDIENQQELRLYIGAKKDNQIYSLCMRNNEQKDSLSWRYDPEHPIMTHGAESLLVTKTEQGSLRQPEPGYRDDVISCISELFAESISVIGKMKAVLTVSADVEDTAFVVKIMEVMEDGRTYNMRTGITTLGYRNLSAKRQIYEPGKKVQLTIDTWDLAWEIQKGSRIRIDLTSSDFPQYSAHSNYAGGWATQKKVRIAHPKVYFGGEDESCICLPILTTKVPVPEGEKRCRETL